MEDKTDSSDTTSSSSCGSLRSSNVTTSSPLCISPTEQTEELNLSKNETKNESTKSEECNHSDKSSTINEYSIPLQRFLVSCENSSTIITNGTHKNNLTNRDKEFER